VGHRETSGMQRPVKAAFEVAEVPARGSASKRGLNAQREIAVRSAGLGQALKRIPRIAQTFTCLGVPLAVAAAGGALGVERAADGVPLADGGGKLAAKRLLRRGRLGLAILAPPGQMAVVEQDLGDGFDLGLAEMDRELGHLK